MAQATQIAVFQNKSGDPRRHAGVVATAAMPVQRVRLA
jgi:hypothetical protein